MAEGNAYEPAALADIEAARQRIADTVVRTPLVRLEIDAPAEIFLKLENLQPIGSFKLRGAGNTIALVDPEALAGGLWTASAGNMAQAVAWHARERGLPCTVVVPETAPKTRLDAIRRLGADAVKVPVPAWLEVFRTRTYPGMQGVFLHPFSDPWARTPGRLDRGEPCCGRRRDPAAHRTSGTVAEGAGAASLAAALSGRAGNGKLVCVVSGGNIDTSTLLTNMAGKLP